jgi:probable O-glycosylation ligase (exosortase A-associated)
MKIFAMTVVLMTLLHTKRHVTLLLAAITASIAFYGVKGGIFTVLTGGAGMVNGPEDSVMEGNNALAVANVMIIPLFGHFYNQTRRPWVRIALIGCILACAAAVIGSYSRGALLALVAMGAVLWVRSQHKALIAGMIAITVIVVIPLMPRHWDTRMETIETFEHESSAMGRIYAWQTAWNIAKDRVMGGGYDYPTPEVKERYSPPQGYVIVAHSIYFQALGEHGFIGLALFLCFWSLVWRRCSLIRRRTRADPQTAWAFSLTSMVQASLAGYAVGGAFLNIAFWDMPYYLYALVVVTDYVVKTAQQPSQVAVASRRQSSGLPLPATSSM